MNELTWPKESVSTWIEQSLEEAFKDKRSAGVVARETMVDFEIPLGVLDSPMHDARFVANKEGLFLGAGMTMASESEEPGSSEKMRAVLRRLPASCFLIGGWSLPRNGKSHRGRGFPRTSWVLPALAFISADERVRAVISANTSLDLGELKRYFHGLIEDVFQPERRSIRVNEMRSTDIPSKRQWVALTQSALQSISRGQFSKVVLARSMRMTLDSEVPISAVVRRLSQSNPSATVFAIRRGARTFLGATPERLLSLEDREVSVDCLAATATRSRERSVDESLGRGLLEDRKSRREHQLVVEGVVRSIASVCSEVRVSGAPRVKKLATVQHLQSFVTGKLRPKEDVWSAAHAIWPTAATGGEPRRPALRWMREHELIDRGWYSGVVGVVRANGDAELAVAIRSGLVEGKTATIYGGAGILEGSNPEAEFAETGWKMRTMVDALVGPVVA